MITKERFIGYTLVLLEKGNTLIENNSLEGWEMLDGEEMLAKMKLLPKKKVLEINQSMLQRLIQIKRALNM